MTIPLQRTIAVLQARDFLEELASSLPQSCIPDHVRLEAIRLLRHYPTVTHMRFAHFYAPMWFGPTDGEQS